MPLPQRCALHSLVVGAAATFWRDPVDDLVGIGDVASFAVDAIRGVDFQFWRAFFGDHFVDCGGTKILTRISVLSDAAVAANIRLEHDKVARLIFFMARAGVVDVGEAVEGEFAVAFETRGLIHESIRAI